MSQMILHFSYPGHEPCTIVKIKLRKTSDQLEFDMFFARIAEIAPPQGMDVTVNWRSHDIDN
jgi:hypothetical protein